MKVARVLALVGVLVAGGSVMSPPAAADAPTGNVHARAQIAVSAAGAARVVPGSVVTSLGRSDSSVTVSRSRVGDYAVRLAGLEAQRGSIVHLVQWGPRPGQARALCRPSEWSNAAGAVEVVVRCADAVTGAPRDGVRFDLWFLQYRHDPEFILPVSHAHAFDGSRTSIYDAVSSPWRSSAGATTVRRTQRGVYEVVFAEAFRAPTPIVTAYDDRPRWCQPSTIRRGADGTHRVEVRCFRVGGEPADSAFGITLAVGDPFFGTGGGARVRIDFPGGELGFSENLVFDAVNENVSLATGVQQVRLDSTVGDGRLVLVAQALDRRPRRCVIVRAPRADIGFDPTIGFVITRCMSGRTGAPVDTTQWVRRLDVSSG